MPFRGLTPVYHRWPLHPPHCLKLPAPRDLGQAHLQLVLDHPLRPVPGVHPLHPQPVLHHQVPLQQLHLWLEVLAQTQDPRLAQVASRMGEDKRMDLLAVVPWARSD